ncbi:MAG: Disulfide bond formation protein DsbA [Nocardioides sp.]|uniref:DsbA family protein n=1 Tax=Nocardioides sp. TaxID=35761 RepID=UPI002623689F|nr:thioredoxin domain-containing protein [Nocardioides sp.]MCW2833066.1 Disulfide bond formation protein DsbA [Nocardioides sp.]
MSKRNVNKTAERAARAAALKAEQERKEKRRRLLLIGGVVAALVFVVAAGFLVQNLRNTTGEAATPPAGVVDDYGVVVGDHAAPTTVTIYEDFQCPVCAEFEKEIGEELNAGIEAGTVKVDYRMVSFLDRASGNEYSSRALNAAAVVLDIAGVDAFKAFHDDLFANQPDEGTDGPEDDELIAAAAAAGADESEVRSAIENKVFAQWIENATEQMSVDEVNGTPTVFIDGELAGSTPQEYADAIRAGLG